MSVIRTDEWLLECYHQPIAICERLLDHFEGASASEIYDNLVMSGMYQPSRNGDMIIQKLKNNGVWENVQNEKQKLQKEWQGPDVPIFIFPSDSSNSQFKQEFNGKSGLAFKDKLFLFVAEDNSEAEIRALFTHEYNHVCRLSKFHKHENHYVLLDTIILEGLAENAVRERFGEKHMARWVSYYSNEELEKMWKTLVQPNRNISNANRKHDELLYGLLHSPKMLGYCTGYYLVKKYLDVKELTCKDLLKMDSAEIASI